MWFKGLEHVLVGGSHINTHICKQQCPWALLVMSEITENVSALSLCTLKLLVWRTEGISKSFTDTVGHCFLSELNLLLWHLIGTGGTANTKAHGSEKQVKVVCFQAKAGKICATILTTLISPMLQTFNKYRKCTLLKAVQCGDLPYRSCYILLHYLSLKAFNSISGWFRWWFWNIFF